MQFIHWHASSRSLCHKSWSYSIIMMDRLQQKKKYYCNTTFLKQKKTFSLQIHTKFIYTIHYTSVHLLYDFPFNFFCYAVTIDRCVLSKKNSSFIYFWPICIYFFDEFQCKQPHIVSFFSLLIETKFNSYFKNCTGDSYMRLSHIYMLNVKPL